MLLYFCSIERKIYIVYLCTWIIFIGVHLNEVYCDTISTVWDTMNYQDDVILKVH